MPRFMTRDLAVPLVACPKCGAKADFQCRDLSRSFSGIHPERLAAAEVEERGASATIRYSGMEEMRVDE